MATWLINETLDYCVACAYVVLHRSNECDPFNSKDDIDQAAEVILGYCPTCGRSDLDKCLVLQKSAIEAIEAAVITVLDPTQKPYKYMLKFLTNRKKDL